MKPHPVFLPLSWLYAFGVGVRNWLFDVGVLSIERVPCAVVSVGNVAAGGSGKTPFVIGLASRFKELGHKVAILSRGYGRTSKGYLLVSDGSGPRVQPEEAGDEATEIASKLRGVIVAVDEQRVRGAKRLIQDHGVDVIVLDDGFQHRYLHRDLDLVLVPADGVMPKHLLPAGMLREPLSSLRRADLLVVTRCTRAAEAEQIRKQLRFQKPVIGVKREATAIVVLQTGERQSLSAIHGKKVLLLSGIASPDSFEATVNACGVRIVDRLQFPDHHWFGTADIKKTHNRFRSSGVEFILTTAKDAVRMKRNPDQWSSLPIMIVESESKILIGGEILDNMLERAIQKGKAWR